MHFLVATDGSQDSERALEHAISLAKAADADLTVVHVVTPRIESGGMDPIESFSDAERRLIVENVEQAEERGERVLEEAAETVEEAGLEVETELLYGEAVESIVEYADPEVCDEVVVGHRGLSDRAESFLGSVANELVRRAAVPVTVVR
ncbi:universal stress protein [Natrialbaceae archaeon A-gly3]